MDRIHKARRIAAIAIGTTKAIFRSGRAWGSARTRMSSVRRPAPTVGARAGAVSGAVAGAAGAYFLDPQNGKRRRHVALDKAKALLRRGAAGGQRKAHYAAGVAKGAAYKATGAGDGSDELPDAELANKVRTEIFRPADAPKGDVSVNAENSVVYLRGQIDSSEQIDQLVAAAREVKGVREVVNLLHLPGQEAPSKGPEGVPVRAGGT